MLTSCFLLPPTAPGRSAFAKLCRVQVRLGSQAAWNVALGSAMDGPPDLNGHVTSRSLHLPILGLLCGLNEIIKRLVHCSVCRQCCNSRSNNNNDGKTMTLMKANAAC